jgi:cold shock protein
MRSSSQPPRNNTFRQPSMVGSEVEVTVKWFDPNRGFGFVKPADGSSDALLPGSVVQFSNIDNLPEGTTLVVDLVEGRKGAQVSAIHSVDASTARPSRPRSERPSGGFGGGGGDRGGDRGGFGGGAGGGGRRGPVGETTDMEGTVKWFNTDKGFGFIMPDGGGRDVFVHVRAIERSGMTGLSEGQRVRAAVRQGEKGPEAVSVDAL